MKTLAALAALAPLALAAATIPAQTPPAQPAAPAPVVHAPYRADEHAGWRSIFDGFTLAGWAGTPGAWQVRDGAIVSENPKGSSYLLWQGGDVADFELKAQVKLEGIGANSGIHFRAQMLGPGAKKNSEWESFAFQADLDDTNGKTGSLSECCMSPGRGPRPRPDKADVGMVVEAAASAADEPRIIAGLGDPMALKQAIRPGEWNDLHLVVRGTTIFYSINGRLMSVFVDNIARQRLRSGKLLLQMEFLNRQGDIKVSFRDLWLKQLP